MAPGSDEDKGGWLPDAELRRRLARHSLAPHHQVESLQRAAHLSRQHDAGVEFEQYRAYQPGDDLRRVDWRAYGRSDRLLVRDAQRDGQLTVAVLLDLSGSMAMSDSTGTTRLNLACRIAGALSWLAARERHALVLAGLGESQPVFLPPASGRAQLERACRVLDALQAVGHWPAASSVHQVLQRLPARSYIVTLSDCFEQTDEIQASLRHLAAGAHDLTMVQILLEQELALPGRGQLRVRDAETGDTRRVDAVRYRAEYQTRMGALLADIRRRNIARGARFVRTATHLPLWQTLDAMLNPALRGRDRLLVGVEQVA